MRKHLAFLLGLASFSFAAAAHADEPSGPAPSGPVVELSADESNATIEKRVGTTGPSGLGIVETGVLSVGQWQHACVAPCQMRLDPNYSYRVSGDGLVPTSSFTIPREGDHVRVDATMGSSPARVGGMLLTGGGLLALAAGGAAMIATPILESEDVGSKGFRTGVLAGGIGALSVGAIATTIGLFMWLSNGSSAHTQTVASSSK
jgi:hypothetical protein